MIAVVAAQLKLTPAMSCVVTVSSWIDLIQLIVMMETWTQVMDAVKHALLKQGTHVQEGIQLNLILAKKCAETVLGSVNIYATMAI